MKFKSYPQARQITRAFFLFLCYTLVSGKYEINLPLNCSNSIREQRAERTEKSSQSR